MKADAHKCSEWTSWKQPNLLATYTQWAMFIQMSGLRLKLVLLMHQWVMKWQKNGQEYDNIHI